jgi:hypothetical protein
VCQCCLPAVHWCPANCKGGVLLQEDSQVDQDWLEWLRDFTLGVGLFFAFFPFLVSEVSPKTVDIQQRREKRHRKSFMLRVATPFWVPPPSLYCLPLSFLPTHRPPRHTQQTARYGKGDSGYDITHGISYGKVVCNLIKVFPARGKIGISFLDIACAAQQVWPSDAVACSVTAVRGPDKKSARFLPPPTSPTFQAFSEELGVLGTEQLGPDMAAATSPDPPDGSPTPHASPTEELEMELEGDNVRMPVVIMLCTAYP